MKKKNYIIKGFNFHTHDLEYYLEKHPMCKLNTRIYKKYTEKGGLDFDIEEIYNEAYYTATRIFHDKYPSNNFYRKYDFYPVDIEKDELLCKEWWMVYFIIHHANANEYRDNLMDFIGCFRSTSFFREVKYDLFDNRIENEKDWINEIDVFQGFDTIEEWNPTEEECRNIDYEPFDFSLDAPLPPNSYNYSEWRAMTNNFNGDYICFIVDSYTKPKDAETATVMIRNANLNTWDEDIFLNSKIEVYKNQEADNKGSKEQTELLCKEIKAESVFGNSCCQDCVVSQEEYDKLVQKCNELTKEIQELKSEIEKNKSEGDIDLIENKTITKSAHVAYLMECAGITGTRQKNTGDLTYTKMAAALHLISGASYNTLRTQLSNPKLSAATKEIIKQRYDEIIKKMETKQ